MNCPVNHMVVVGKHFSFLLVVEWLESNHLTAKIQKMFGSPSKANQDHHIEKSLQAELRPGPLPAGGAPWADSAAASAPPRRLAVEWGRAGAMRQAAGGWATFDGNTRINLRQRRPRQEFLHYRSLPFFPIEKQREKPFTRVSTLGVLPFPPSDAKLTVQLLNMVGHITFFPESKPGASKWGSLFGFLDLFDGKVILQFPPNWSGWFGFGIERIPGSCG